MTVASTSTPRPMRRATRPVGTTRLPGGATLEPLCDGTGWVALRVAGELDVHDRYAIIDALTPYVLAGCLRIDLDAHAVTFADLSALRSLDRVRRFLARDGGTLTVDGLPRIAAYAWHRLHAGLDT